MELDMQGWLRHSNVGRHENRRVGERPGEKMGTTGVQTKT
jgi:hypothetical protein